MAPTFSELTTRAATVGEVLVWRCRSRSDAAIENLGLGDELRPAIPKSAAPHALCLTVYRSPWTGRSSGIHMSGSIVA